MFTCRLSGLTIDSCFDVPGAVRRAAGGEPDVRIVAGPVPETLGDALAGNGFWQASPDRFLQRVPGICRMVAEAGARLVVATEPGVDPAHAVPFVVGGGLAALLWQRGTPVIEAAAVVEDGRAYALMGGSNSGKSTLAAALCLSGSGFLADDLVALSIGETPAVLPEGRGFALIRPSLERFGFQRGGAVRPGIAKYHVPPPGAVATDPMPLAAIYLLDAQRAPRRGPIERLSTADAAQALLDHIRLRPLALAIAPQSTTALMRALAKRVPVYRFVRPLNLRWLDASVARLRAHLRGGDAA